jgi:hypothetical protein
MMLLITALVVLIYLVTVTIKFGWLPSISRSYYELKHNWVFTLFMWFVGISVMYMGGKDASNLAANIFYIGGSFLLFVGVYPRFEEDHKWQHYICALLGLLITLIAFIFRDGNYLPILLFLTISGILVFLKLKNLYFWIEIVFIILTFLALI